MVTGTCKQSAVMAGQMKKSKAKIIEKLKPTDVFCYICRGVLIEPVTVPCKHVYCRRCFDNSMQETSYSCPLCRRRISNWVRSAKKTDKLLNIELWMRIKDEFSEEVAKKLAGEDDGLDERIEQESKHNIILAESGTIGKEFLNLSRAYEEEERIRLDNEERESMELIRKLQEEEEMEDRETQKMLLRLQEQAEKSSGDENQEILPKKTPRSKKKLSAGASSCKKESTQPQLLGPMDHYVKKLSLSQKLSPLQVLQRDDNRPSSSTSTDSLAAEMNHFKPICCVPKTPPKRTQDGKVVQVMLQRITPIKKLFTEQSNSKDTRPDVHRPHSIHSAFSAFRGLPSAEGETESPSKKMKLDPDIGVLKEINFDENSDSNSGGFVCADDEALQEHLLVEKRLLQEKEDRELALKLSKEWSNYSLRRPQNQRSCRNSARQTTLIDTVIRNRKK